MKRLYWIARAALYMRSVFEWWKPTDLLFCWRTADTIYGNYEYENRLDEIGEPSEEMAEELSNWTD